VSPLPANRELRERHPHHVHLVAGLDELPRAVDALGPRPATAPSIPTWDDVAAQLTALYRDLAP
jgi:hypothetical protein